MLTTPLELPDLILRKLAELTAAKQLNFSHRSDRSFGKDVTANVTQLINE